MKRSKLRLIFSLIALVILLQALGNILLRTEINPNVKNNARAFILLILLLLIADIVNIIHIFVRNSKQSKFEAIGREATPSPKPATILKQPTNTETVGNPRVVDLRSDAEKKTEQESGNALEAEHEAFAQELFCMFKTSRPYDSMALLKEVTEKYSPTAQKIANVGYNPALKKIYYRVTYLCKKEGVYFHPGTLDNIFDGEYWSK
jgi:hypothetical protein